MHAARDGGGFGCAKIVGIHWLTWNRVARFKLGATASRHTTSGSRSCHDFATFRLASKGYSIADSRRPERLSRNEQIATEPPMAPLDLPLTHQQPTVSSSGCSSGWFGKKMEVGKLGFYGVVTIGRT